MLDRIQQAKSNHMMQALASKVVANAPRQLDPLLAIGRRYIMPILRPKLSASILSGEAKSGHSLNVLVIDPRLTANRMTRLLFESYPDVAWSSRIDIFRLKHLVAKMRDEVDLVLATIPRATPRSLRPTHRLHMPALIECHLEVAEDLEAQLQLVHGKRRNRLRRAQRSGLSWRVGETNYDIRRFIERYHRPFVSGRFGADVVLRERSILERLARRGGVLWLMHEGREIGGDLFHVDDDLLWLMVTGEVADPPKTVPTIQEILPLFATDLARQLGCRKLSFGAAAPLLREGLLQFKLSFGVKVVDYPQSHRELLVDWVQPSLALHRLLSAFPFVVRSHAGFDAATSTFGVDANAHFVETNKLLPAGVNRLLDIHAC